MSPLRNSQISRGPQKISGSPDMNFCFWGPVSQKGGRRPQLMAGLGRDTKGARSAERTAAISVAVAEKIAFENFFSAPPGGESWRRRDAILCTPSLGVQRYIVLNFCVPRPPRSDAIRLFRNLKMPPCGNARTRSVAIYARQIIKNTNDRVEKISSTLHTHCWLQHWVISPQLHYA